MKKINQTRTTRKRLVSVRIDEGILNEFRSKNLNLSLAINELLRGYLYIQNHDNNCPRYGSSRFPSSSVKIDVYFKDSLDYEI